MSIRKTFYRKKKIVASKSPTNEKETGLAVDLNDQAFKRMRVELEKRYRGNHIAIANGQLISVANTYDELVVELRRRRIQRCLTVQVGVDESGEGGVLISWSVRRIGLVSTAVLNYPDDFAV